MEKINCEHSVKHTEKNPTVIVTSKGFREIIITYCADCGIKLKEVFNKEFED